MYDIYQKRINNAHFKLYFDTAEEDLTVLSEGFVVEHEPERAAQYGSKG